MANTTYVTDTPTNPTDVSYDQRLQDIQEAQRRELDALKAARKSPFKSFIQVNKDRADDLMWLVTNNPNAYKVLMFLWAHMDNYNAVVCSYRVLQDYFGQSRTTLSRAVNFLVQHGFVYVQKSGTTNVYITNPDIAWTSWGNNRRYCEFPANVILSAAEQDNIIKIKDTRPKTVVVTAPDKTPKQPNATLDEIKDMIGI